MRHVSPALWILASLSLCVCSCQNIRSQRCEPEGDGEAWYCPEYMVCHPYHRCVTTAQVERCADEPELAPCELPGTPEGSMRCRQGVCITPYCGDGVKDAEEVCDVNDLGGTECTDLGYYEGQLGCLSDCSAHDTSGCHGECGDGEMSGPEACDGNELGGLTCVDFGYSTGSLVCAPDCASIDNSGCAGICGNDIRDADEACDGADFGAESCLSYGFYTGSLVCDPSCLSIYDSGCTEYCSDGIINGPEACDGAALGGLACTNFGLFDGNLACLPDCSDHDTTGCYDCGGDTFECLGDGTARVCQGNAWVLLGACTLGCDAVTRECRVPSNVAAEDMLQGTGTLTVTAADPIVTIDTDTGEITGNSGTLRAANVLGLDPVSGIWFEHRTQTGTSIGLGVFAMTGLDIQAGTEVDVVGSRALVLLVDGAVTLDGVILVNGGWNGPGPGGFGGGPHDGDGLGPCPGLAGAGNLHDHGCSSGSGGGGHGGSGGAGGDATCGGYVGGAGGSTACGNPVLVPLVGGSGGAGGPEWPDDPAASNPGMGGDGGGAIQIAAAGVISINGSGGINAGGGGGRDCTSSGGSGGGAGGAILLEAPVVTVAVNGVLAANGGGGGGGDCL